MLEFPKFWASGSKQIWPKWSTKVAREWSPEGPHKPSCFTAVVMVSLWELDGAAGGRQPLQLSVGCPPERRGVDVLGTVGLPGLQARGQRRWYEDLPVYTWDRIRYQHVANVGADLRRLMQRRQELGPERLAPLYSSPAFYFFSLFNKSNELFTLPERLPPPTKPNFFSSLIQNVCVCVCVSLLVVK